MQAYLSFDKIFEETKFQQGVAGGNWCPRGKTGVWRGKNWGLEGKNWGLEGKNWGLGGRLPSPAP